MASVSDSLFVTLEYDKHLPKLDLHGIRPEAVETTIFNFFMKLNNLGYHTAQVIFGRGGSGILKQKTIEFLDKNMAEIDPKLKLVRAWKESVLEGAGGRCLAILEE